MTPAFIASLLLVLLGLAGAANEWMRQDDHNLLVATLSGLAVGIGFVWMGIVAARHGYHRRPPGAPPGDMDPHKATDPLN